METQYAGDFLASLVNAIQNISQNHFNLLKLKQSIEVNGYISVEMDNLKKERYVLSELLQSSGNVVSESFRVKAAQNKTNMRFAGNPDETKDSSAGTTSVNTKLGIGRNISMKRSSDAEFCSTKLASDISKRLKSCDTTKTKACYQTSSMKTQLNTENIIKSSHHVTRKKTVPRYSFQLHVPVHGKNPVPQCSVLSLIPIAKKETVPPNSSPSGRHIQRENSFLQYSSNLGENNLKVNAVPQYSSQSHQEDDGETSTMTRSNMIKCEAGVSVPIAPGQAQQADTFQKDLSSIDPNSIDGGKIASSENNDNSPPYIDSALSRETCNVYETSSNQMLSQPPATTTGNDLFSTFEETSTNNYVCGSAEGKLCIKIENTEDDVLEDVNLKHSTASGAMEVNRSTTVDSLAPINTGSQKQQNSATPGKQSAMNTGKHPTFSSLGKQQSSANPRKHRNGKFQGKQHNAESSAASGAIRSAVNQFNLFFLYKYGHNMDLLSLSHQELDASLLDFFKGVKKQNGENLPARNLCNMHKYLSMYLNDQGSPFCITKDDEFTSSRNYLQQRLEESGEKCVPVQDTDVEKLFRTRQLGGHSPEAIINTMWFINSKYLGIKLPIDHMNLKWGDVCLKTNKQGLEFIEHAMNDSFSFKVHAKPTDPTKCFVNIYKQYWKARPLTALDQESPFYLKCPESSTSNTSFLPDAMSCDHYLSMLKTMTAGGQLDSKNIL